MPRKNIIPTSKLTLMLPEDIRAKLDLFLYSELEGRVPQGAYQSFFTARIQEFFGWRRLMLEPFGFPSGYFIAGPRDMIERMEDFLKSSPIPTTERRPTL